MMLAYGRDRDALATIASPPAAKGSSALSFD
jgi:hypothetical protein